MGEPRAREDRTIEDEDTDTTRWRRVVDDLVTRGETVPTALEMADLILQAHRARSRSEVPPSPSPAPAGPTSSDGESS
jgi:hypothetical protein